MIGGSLVQINWRWVFWINLPVGLAAVLLAAEGGAGEQGRRRARAGRT